MQTVTDTPVLRNALAGLRAGGGTVALVPTMGALHDGHLALVREARTLADHVVASIFVNPRQFGAGEDLDAYPRPFARDQAMLAAEGVAVLWAPTPAAMYPDGFGTGVVAGPLGEPLCGASRPGHFDGVATVVLKLFNQVEPDLALFGEKDWQQLAVIRQLARDLDLTRPAPAAIRGVATVREDDGLALSSRNAYLTGDERARAAALPAALREAAAALLAGEAWSAVRGQALRRLADAGFGELDYLDLRDGHTLAALDRATPAARLFVAVRLGKARLIDNWPAAPSAG